VIPDRRVIPDRDVIPDRRVIPDRDALIPDRDALIPDRRVIPDRDAVIPDRQAIRVGTRGSALALAQAAWVGERLGSPYELVKITTAGDRGAAIADKSRWTSALEQAVLAGEIDLAVHSAKDVPADLAGGLELVAFPARASALDAICGASGLGELPAGARVGTSSLRRAAQIRAARDDLTVVEVRGNVDTRLAKLARGECDALVLAYSGLERLGRVDAAGGVLDELVPAAGQGALALEALPGRISASALAGVSDPVTTACVRAERDLVRALGASCNTPVGALGHMLEDGRVELRGWAGRPDGSAWVSDRLSAEASSVGAEVAERMLAAGAREMLRAAERGMRA
jgi:hydroxymethylbilane synthase